MSLHRTGATAIAGGHVQFAVGFLETAITRSLPRRGGLGRIHGAHLTETSWQLGLLHLSIPLRLRPFRVLAYDNGFFSVVAILVLVTVSTGSGPTDYFALAVRANAHLKLHTFPAMRRSANPITVNHRRAS